MTKIKNGIILITGGTSGIGRIMGRMVLERGAKQLVVWCVSQAKIDETIADFRTRGYDNVRGYCVDVSDSSAVVETYKTMRKDVGMVDVLINNAGVVTGNMTFDRAGITDIDRTMDINAKAPMVVALQMLPEMIERDSGHICNIASAAGLVSNPKMAIYAASKWAVVGWSDSVRIELQVRRSNVHITTIAPYYINTGMFDGVKSRVLPILDPERTSRKILRAIECNRDFRGLPLGFHIIRLAQGIMPISWFDFIFGRVCGIYTTMDEFTGRKH